MQRDEAATSFILFDNMEKLLIVGEDSNRGLSTIGDMVSPRMNLHLKEKGKSTGTIHDYFSFTHLDEAEAKHHRVLRDAPRVGLPTKEYYPPTWPITGSIWRCNCPF